MRNPTPRMRILDGFNEGWIEFGKGETGSRQGEVVKTLLLVTLIEPEGK